MKATAVAMARKERNIHNIQSGWGHRDDRAKIGRKIVKDLIIKWDPEVDLRRLIYESYVVFHAGSFYDSPEVRFLLLRG